MQNKEISPAMIIGAIALVVIVIGIFIYQQASNNPPTPRPDPKYFGGGKTTTPAP